MAYNQINRLKRVYVIQEYYLIKKKDGVTNKRIWENVCTIFPISKDTFYNYLKENARKALKENDVDIDELNKYKEHVINTLQGFEKPIIADIRY
jgi:hypothetical protein